jgi:hypothetical protein
MGVSQGHSRVEIEQQGVHRLVAALVEVPGQLGQTGALASRVIQELVHVHGDAPAPHPEPGQQGVQPVGAAAGLAEARGRGEHTHVRLRPQELEGAVGRAVVNEEEAADPQLAVVPEKRRQAQALVAQLREQPDVGLAVPGGRLGRAFEEDVAAGRHGSADSPASGPAPAMGKRWRDRSTHRRPTV